MRAFLSLCVVSALGTVTGCAAVIDDDFDRYVATPTQCDPAHARDADERAFLRCSSSQTCAPATPSGEYSTTEAHCFPLVNQLQEGEFCSYDNECSAGMFCGSAGCARYCRVDDGNCADGAECLPLDDGNRAGGAPLGVCRPKSCTPLGDDCDGACSFYEPTRTACFPRTGSSRKGAACINDSDCREGLACGTEGACTEQCRVGGNECGARKCIQTEAGETLNGTAYGYCALQ